jgi:diguanylate cyclase (GGDEF)-like protein
MSVTLAGVLELGLVTGSLALASAGGIVALRTRAAARHDREALRTHREREAKLVDAATRLAAAARSSADAVRDEIVRAVRATAPSVDGVLLYEEHDGTLRCVAAAGERFAYYAGSCVALDDAGSLPARALTARHRVTPSGAGTRPVHPCDGGSLAVPLVLDSGRRCVLVVAALSELGADAVERVVTLADLAAPAYLIALDREHDRRDAEYDGLTGLLTPRAFRRRLAALAERARFIPTVHLALLFVDTDHFKRWNDRFGHAAGDALLRELANVLRSAAVLPSDLVARNGGDEFCVVFTETGKGAAIERAEILRRSIAALDLRDLLAAETNADVPISASIGVAAFPADASSASDLLEAADAAMYHAKETGRDAVSYRNPDGTFVRLGLTQPAQQPSSERPISSFVSELPTIL